MFTHQYLFNRPVIVNRNIPLSQEADLMASAKRQQGYLREELASLLDEIDDVEEDRERWKRQLR